MSDPIGANFYFQWMCRISISSCLCSETNFRLHSKSWARRTKCMLPRTHFQYWSKMLLQRCPPRPDQWSTMSMSENRLQHNLNHVIHFDSATHGQFGQFSMAMTNSVRNYFHYTNVSCDICHVTLSCDMWHIRK